MLLSKLKSKPFLGNWHYFLIASIIVIAASDNKFLFIPLGVLVVYLFLRQKQIFIPILIVCCYLFCLTNISNLKKLADDKYYDAKIVETKNNGYIIKIKTNKVRIVDYNNEFKPGDIVNIKFKRESSSLKSYETDFDYARYLKTQGIIYQAKVIDVKLVKSSISINIIKNKMIEFYKEKLSPDAFNYISTMVLSSNSLDENLKEGYSVLGISYILAISGMHIIFLYKIISWILFKIFRYYRSIIPISILAIYVILIGFPPACIRALLFLILSKLNEKGEKQYTKMDLLAISFMLMVSIRPFYIYNTGFILSFLVSFVILFINPIIKNMSFLKKNYISFLIIYLSTIPVVTTFQNKISLFALLFSPILGLVVSYLLLPLCYVIAVFPFLDVIFKYIFIFLNEYIINLSNLSISISIPSFNFIMYVIYYLLYSILIISIRNKKNIFKQLIVFLIYLAVLININIITPLTKITFIDVGQGDSCLIKQRNNKGNILIDAYNSLDYLKSTGINEIDTLIITHSDNDHIKEANEVIEYFKVKNIYYPIYDDKCKEILNDKGTGIKNNTRFIVGEIEFEALGPIDDLDNVNSNSLVVKMNLDNKSFLFTGDMTKEEEKTLVDSYGKILKSDVLKVAHHGSRTSSDDLFLSYVAPKYSIISVADNNNYGLPNDEIVDKLKKISSVYMTKNNGNISFIIYKNKMTLLTYR